jgi:signal transduction histidine kinase/ligand-binding sensor domain-containing protein
MDRPVLHCVGRLQVLMYGSVPRQNLQDPLRSILLCLSLLLAAGSSRAVDSGRHISQYGHTAWRVQDGVFTGAPSAITQTVDGYMWIGTENGVVRFDGVRFTPWKPDGNELPSSDVINIVGTRDGSLWIATTAGLSHWHNGASTNFIHDPAAFDPLVESRDGTIWVVREEIGTALASVCRITGSGLQCYRDGNAIPPGVYTAIATEDTSGDLWIGSQTALVRWRPGSSSVYTPPALSSHAGEGITGIVAKPDGSLWVGMALSGHGLGLQRFVRGVWKPFVVPGFDSSTLEVQTLFLDHNDTLWIGTLDQGIYRIAGEHVDHFGSADGLSGDGVRQFSEDREGNLWVTTFRGIDCFHDVRVASFSKREGITVTELGAVLAARDGTVWIGGADALNALYDNKVTSIHAPKGVPGNQYTAIFEDHAGHMWIGIDSTLWIYANGAFHRVTRQDGRDTGVIADITEDVDNNIWAESIGIPRTLLRIRGLTVEEEFPASAIPAAHTIAADRESGIWLGLLNGDLARYRHGNLETFHFEHALPAYVLQIAIDPDGSVLGATRAGLIGWRNGTQRTLTVKNGLPCGAVFGFVRDSQGALWLYTQCGLVQIAATALQAWWEHSEAQIPLRVFDSFDGVQPGRAPFRSAARSPDGRLWFVNLSLLQMIDPAHLDGNPMPPPVYIEQVIADRRSYLAKDGLRLPALTRDLEIDYTALSFMAPQKMRFRYRLEGRDTEWQDSGTRRQAFYTDLRPGHYRFRAIASNNDGVWNETGAAVDLEIPPAFGQTRWFLAIWVVAGAAALWLLFILRLRQLQERIRSRLEERLLERERIARDLHDTLLQGMQGLVFKFQAAAESLPSSDSNRDRLEEALDLADEVLEDGRDKLAGLRGFRSESQELFAALTILGQSLADERSITFHSELEGEPKVLHPIVREEAYRIGAEALTNSFNHAKAGSIELEIRYGTAALRLLVRDDGVGIEESMLAEPSRANHFGLVGMRERAAKISSRLEIFTRPGAGTEVHLRVPATMAYRLRTLDKSQSWLTRKFRVGPRPE